MARASPSALVIGASDIGPGPGPAWPSPGQRTRIRSALPPYRTTSVMAPALIGRDNATRTVPDEIEALLAGRFSDGSS